MFQFYYDDKNEFRKCKYNIDVNSFFEIELIRTTMWEEHCLECSAPACYKNCSLYKQRIDGRCLRFNHGIQVWKDEGITCARISFRKWSNLMTIIYPSMVNKTKAHQIELSNNCLGNHLFTILSSKVPMNIKWKYVRIVEFIRRMFLKKMKYNYQECDAFVFQGYNFENFNYNLIIDVYDGNSNISVFKFSLSLKPGENVFVLNRDHLSNYCDEKNFLIKLYPENNLEVELDVKYCDFVVGKIKNQHDKFVKCVIWDLDNTVWDGVLIETEDINQLKIKPHVLQIMNEFDKRGILQSIASKNDHMYAWNIIKKNNISHYFLYPQINWGPKSISLKRISENLNINMDSLAFIDDSVFEREEVKYNYPQVRVYDANNIDDILSYPEFNVMVTEESKSRREMYQSEEKRISLLNDMNFESFLKKCELKAKIYKPISKDDLLRCYELVIRTNQLNMSGKKYSEEEFQSIVLKPNNRSYAVFVEDTFGKYGIVIFAQYYLDNDIVIFTEFAMSCRVANKYIESALFYNILLKEKSEKGIFNVIKTKKNLLLRTTLENIGFKKVFETEDKIKYQFDKNLLNKEIVECTLEEI